MKVGDRVKVVSFNDAYGEPDGLGVVGDFGTVIEMVSIQDAVFGRIVEVQLDESFRLMFEPSELEVI